MMAVEIPKEFFTLQSMLTLTGATGATFVISNGLQRAFNFNPKWLALAIALLICLVGVAATSGKATDYFIGIVNGFLVYCTAAGATSMSGGGDGGPSPTARGAKDAIQPQLPSDRRRFLSPWF